MTNKWAHKGLPLVRAVSYWELLLLRFYVLESRDHGRVLPLTAGLCVAKPNNKKREKKDDVSREVNPLTFRSLRHAEVS